jgi:hypothetical protein
VLRNGSILRAVASWHCLTPRPHLPVINRCVLVLSGFS